MTTRRPLVLSLLAAAAALSTPGLALAQAKLKVAGIYTVPFEQQWAGRLHQALKAAEARGEIEYKASENVSNADYERVMREYATAGNQLIVGEAFAVEAAARKVAKDYPKIAFLMGIACSLMLTIVGWLWHQVFLGMVVGVSLITAFLVSTSMATVMPIVLKRMGVDPAVAAGPFVTTANDITGIAIYLTLATIFLEQLR